MKHMLMLTALLAVLPVVGWAEVVPGKRPNIILILTDDQGYGDFSCNGKAPPNTAKFFGMVANIDDNLGRLLAKLEEWRIDRDTLVIFMNDMSVGLRRFLESWPSCGFALEYS